MILGGEIPKSEYLTFFTMRAWLAFWAYIGAESAEVRVRMGLCYVPGTIARGFLKPNGTASIGNLIMKESSEHVARVRFLKLKDQQHFHNFNDNGI